LAGCEPCRFGIRSIRRVKGSYKAAIELRSQQELS
jgi:hypothetical protein